MDYDNTDFQSQNFQLAGEDNNKFPSGLRPFALPKFDIDDQLQGHLRFDTLIDSEVFFSVQDHDCNWIEVLSAGSSVVDFSSSAAESCSLARTNNVWSEATSAESVEMLLNSVGENEMTTNIDGNAHHQLGGMDSQTNPFNMQDKSSNSPTGSVPNESNDQFQSTLSKVTEDPSRTQPQVEDIVPISMDEKSEQVVGSNLSDRKSNYMLEPVADKCVLGKKLPSASKDTSKSSLTVGDYFEVVPDDNPLDNLKVKLSSGGVDSRRLNNEPFSQLAPLQNIYATDSYHLEPDNQESGVVAEIGHRSEHNVEGGLCELKNLSHTGSQPSGTTKLSDEVSNETLLSVSSDGLLESITNPVKILNRSDNTSKGDIVIMHPSFSHVEHAVEDLKGSVAKGDDHGISEEAKSAGFHQSEPDLRNPIPYLVNPLSTKNSKLIQCPTVKQPAYVMEVLEETKNAGVNDTNVDLDGNSKLGVTDLHQNSDDPLKIGVMEEKKVGEESFSGSEDIPLQNSEQIVRSGCDEEAKGTTTDASKDKLDSSGGVTTDNSSDGLLDEKDLKISSINHEGSSIGGATHVLEDKSGDHYLVSPISGCQGKISAALVSSSSNAVSATVTDTTDTSKDKLDSSCGGVAPDDSTAGSLNEKDLKISSVKLEGSFKRGTKPASEDEPGGHYAVFPISGPEGKESAASVNSSVSAVSSSVTDAVAKKTECKEQATSSASLAIRETQDKLGNGENNSVNHPVASSHICQSDGPSVQSVYHEDLAIPSAAVGVSSDNARQTMETQLNSKDDLNAHFPDKVLNQGAEQTPSTVSSKSRADSLSLEYGSGVCTKTTCGSPTATSCGEPCLQEGGQGSNALLDHTVRAKSEDSKEPAASADAVQSSEKCSSSKEETMTTGNDRSFSFETGTLLNLSEKALSPGWKPFPRPKADQSTEAATENTQAGSSLKKTTGSSLKKTSEDNKETCIVGTDKVQLLGKNVADSQGCPSVSSHSGDITKTKSVPSEESQQPPTSESSTLVHQPFTDVQHVQLRAQIFVYGALIQGIPPAEAYMMSAFGEPVCGGKPAWEEVWRAAVKRFQNQKSPLAGLETPTSSRIGSCVPEKVSKDIAVKKTAPASKTGGKFVPSARSPVPLHLPTVNTTSSLGSLALNLQRGTQLDFSQAASPVFAYHSSQMRQPTSSVASWFAQSPSPRPAHWLVPPQSLIFDSSMQPAVPTTETAKVIPSKNLSISQAVSPGVFLPSKGPSSVSPTLAVVHEEKQKAPASTPKRGATSQKPRKRKKTSASPGQQPVITAPQLKTDPAPITPAMKHPSGFTLSTHSPSNVLVSGHVPNTGQIASVPNYQITGSKGAEQGVIFSEQICSAIEQTKGQAEGATMHSMEARRHNDDVWSQLSTNSRNMLPSEVEEKLASAAAAAAAAVSVAKAAAGAAKMASDAALQAKMMADEALGSSKSVTFPQKHVAGKIDVHSNPATVAGITPASTWIIKDMAHAPVSSISVAREVARKRVEEASAAAKRAENLDVILKAAESTAEAVCQAGTIIAMGDPLPFTLSELLEAGPDGYWKSDRVKHKKPGNTSNKPMMESLEVDVPDDVNKSGEKGSNQTKHRQAIQNMESSSNGKELLELEGVQSGNGAEDVPTTGPLNSNRNDIEPGGIIWKGIEKGSLVEVLADDGGLGGAWFSAKVLDINESSVCISYDDHREGTGHRKEWVPLEQEGDRAPRIRLAHPATVSKLKGTRKRRRGTTGNYSWAIGDHVDAWMKNCWREGVIAQNCEGDETKFLVQFPAGGGDSLLLHAWELRPSLVWKDGQWTEWCCVRERKAKSNKGDSPYEKRQRTGLLQAGSDLVPVGGEAVGPSMDKNTDNVTKAEELKTLALSGGDLIFNAGKSVVENKTGALAFKRPGLQKEGSRVVYGVPRPGKKRKFMEVSKHYVADQVDKVLEGNASTRFAKYLIPQVPRPRENTLKADQRGRRVGEMRSRGRKSTKSQNITVNNNSEKDLLSISSSGAFESSFAFAGGTAAPPNIENQIIEKKNSAFDAGPRTEDASVSESHMQAAPTVSTKKNLFTGDRARRKFVPSVDISNRNESRTSEIPGKASSDFAEPRRSNRRIQPTSRLLEGLQSSLIISKVPGEKGARSHYRSASSRGRAHD